MAIKNILKSPILLTALLIVLIGIVYFVASKTYEREIKKLAQNALDEEASYLLRNLEDRLTFLTKDLVDRYNVSPPRDQKDHLQKTKNLIESNPFLLTINYISSDRRIRFVSPFEQNKAVIGLKIEIAAPKEALEQAKSSLRPYLSRPFEIIQGELGYSLMVPYDSGDEFFELVFKAENVFGNNSQFRLFKDVELIILDENLSVLNSPELESLPIKSLDLQVEGKGTLLNRTLQFKAFPSKELLENTAYFWQLIATGSILLCFVLLIITIALQSLSITEREKSQKKLEKAKKEIEVWNMELEKRVKEKTAELEKSQSQLIQSEKLSAMGRMAGGLAHELTSPVAGLLPMLEMLRGRVEKSSREYEELSLMLKSTHHMARIVRDFGVFSRKSEGKFELLNLNEIIEDTLSFSSSSLRKSGIKIQQEFSRRPALVRGNRTELQQVVINMLSNAASAMPEGGNFIIKTHLKDKYKAVMEFIDNGIGIEKENIDKIFEPFFTTKKEGEGTGIGLAIAYGIIEKHGGKISVESEPGNGTKFTIILPTVEYK